MNSTPKLLLVEDHVLVRHGVKLILQAEPGFEVVGEAGTAKEAVEKALALQPDVVVLDIDLGGVSGLSVAQEILTGLANTRVVVLSADSTPENVQQALHVGVSGYVLKNSANDELVRAIHTVLNGQCYLCPEITTALARSNTLRSSASNSNPPLLTDRDCELLRLIAAGHRNKEIAEKFSLSIKSIEANRSKLMHKLGCNSAAELVRYAVREGIAEL